MKKKNKKNYPQKFVKKGDNMFKHNAQVLYHSSIKIDDIFIDPYKITGEYKAKYIFITHAHYDHYSVEDIKKIVTAQTIFVAPSDVAKDLKKNFKNEIIVMHPEQKVTIGELSVYAFPSYNVNKNFHKKEFGWLGYLIEYKGIKYAILGDCDENEDNRKIKCDVLIIPIGGTYTMNGKEAANLTKIINPKLVIPDHYNAIVGTKENEKEFKDALNGKFYYEIFL